MLDGKINSRYEALGCPYYDHETKTWRVKFQERDAEEGDLLYVVSEFTYSGLYYPYNDKQTCNKEYNGHSHSFEGVIEALLEDPDGFTISGFEEYYSQQEIRLLTAIKEKITCLANGCKIGELVCDGVNAYEERLFDNETRAKDE